MLPSRSLRRLTCALLLVSAPLAGCVEADGPPPRDEGRNGDPLSPAALMNLDGGPGIAATFVRNDDPGGGSSSSRSRSDLAAGGAPSALDAGPAPVTTIGARHVLIQYVGAQSAGSSVVRTREQAHRVAEEVLRRAQAGEDLGKLAVEFSDEPHAAERGGSLGHFGRGQMVKEFEEAAFRLKVGEISPIVETGFGFHIIQRTE